MPSLLYRQIDRYAIVDAKIFEIEPEQTGMQAHHNAVVNTNVFEIYF